MSLEMEGKTQIWAHLKTILSAQSLKNNAHSFQQTIEGNAFKAIKEKPTKSHLVFFDFFASSSATK